jgi:hypothetical protein
MKNKLSVLMTAVGLSVASLSANAAVNAFLVIGDQSPTPMTMTGAIDILSFSFGASQTAVIGAGGVNISDPMTGGAFTMGTVTMNPNSTESFGLADPLGEMLQFTTNQLVTPVNQFVGINTIQFGATGGPMSECNVTPGVACTTTSFQVKAPEIDPAAAISGLTLLAGAILVLRGRRRVLTPC